MDMTCRNCHVTFDDAERTTICPHELIMPREDLERKKLAFTLVGKPLRFCGIGVIGSVDPFRPPLFIESISWNGMISLRGKAAYGEFAPHLFTVVEKQQDVEQLP